MVLTRLHFSCLRRNASRVDNQSYLQLFCENMSVLRSTEDAHASVTQAEKALSGWGMFGNKYEKALDLYTKAINTYKMNKNWQEAGDTLLKTVQCHIKLDSRFDAANAYLDAAAMYQKVDKKLAVQALTDAISAFLDFGKLDKVGRIEQQLAELYEESEEKEDLEKAVEHYQKAADFFEGENQRTTANTCTQKVAHLKAMVGQYSDALVAFEKSARNAVDDKLLKYGAKDHFFKAALCAICAMENPVEELDEFKQRLEGYKDDDVNFPDSYECKLLDKIVLSMDEKNIKNFQAAVREYNNIKKLDNWKTQILLTVKEKVAKFTEADLDLT